jgi:hypothetical protein
VNRRRFGLPARQGQGPAAPMKAGSPENPPRPA